MLAAVHPQPALMMKFYSIPFDPHFSSLSDTIMARNSPVTTEIASILTFSSEGLQNCTNMEPLHDAGKGISDRRLQKINA